METNTKDHVKHKFATKGYLLDKTIRADQSATDYTQFTPNQLRRLAEGKSITVKNGAKLQVPAKKLEVFKASILPYLDRLALATQMQDFEVDYQFSKNASQSISALPNP